ncbi:MAG: alpha/beta hydrolase, partial [Chloroflexi bacterium]|nr:alpha/beta hydrolase [Chloroflexota bacterium]
LMARVFFDLDVDAVLPIEQVRSHPERAFLFVGCERDATVYAHHAREMKAASVNPGTELWMLPDCGHVKAFITHPAEWEARVVTFLEGQLGK